MTSPPTFPAAGTIVLRLPRSLYASMLILVCYDPTTLVLNMSKISVLGAQYFPIIKTLPRPYYAYEDPTKLLRFVIIGVGVKQYQKHVYSKLIIKILCNHIYLHMFFEQLNKMLKVFKNSHILLCMLIIAVIFVWQPDNHLHVYAIITLSI